MNTNHKYYILRTKNTVREYEKFIEDGKENPVVDLTHKKSIRDFKYWRIVDNKYPQDAIATVANMLIPKRVFARRSEMTTEESNELKNILENEICNDYSAMYENMPKQKSIKNHFHIHLWKLREFDFDDLIS